MEILKKHPEIKELMGPEPLTKYCVAATVLLQVGMAWLTLEWSWPAYLAAVYVVGATANHSLFLAIHELSHNLGFKKVEHNKYLSMLANFPIFIPYCITFKPYHMEHHRYQGDQGVDTDIPTELGPLPTRVASLGGRGNRDQRCHRWLPGDRTPYRCSRWHPDRPTLHVAIRVDDVLRFPTANRQTLLCRGVAHHGFGHLVHRPHDPQDGLHVLPDLRLRVPPDARQARAGA
jgi:hypothetical protein